MRTFAYRPSATTAGSGDDYGYSNARVRGMRARLMRGEQFELLLRQESLQDLIGELMKTDYGPDLEETLITGRTVDNVNAALRDNVIRTHRKVINLLCDQGRLIVTTLLGRWDIFNIKTVLRGINSGVQAQDISQGLFPVGELSQVDLDGLLIQGDVRGLVDTARTWELPFAAALSEGFAEYQESGKFVDIELALDRHYAAWALPRLQRRGDNFTAGRRILHMQVDMLNLVMVFKAVREDLDLERADSYFIDGGSVVSRDLYLRLTSLSEVDEIIGGLKGTRYHKICAKAALAYLERNSLTVFERALEDDLARRIIATAGKDPLGVGVPLSYLWGKQNEATNLRIIVKGTQLGIPDRLMRKEFILV